MFLERLFSHKVLEARLQDKDREIARLITDNQDLRDRLFIKHSLPVSGAPVTTSPGEVKVGWGSKRTRIRDYINEQHPLAATLSDEEMLALREASQ